MPKEAQLCSVDGGQVLRDLFRILICNDDRGREVFARLTVSFGSGAEVTFTNESGAKFMITIPSEQTTTIFTIKYVDKNGNPAKVDGAPVWTGPDPMFGTFTVEPNGLAARLDLPDPVVQGTFQLRVDADANLGDGVKSLVTLGDVEIIGFEAVAGVISATPPV